MTFKIVAKLLLILVLIGSSYYLNNLTLINSRIVKSFTQESKEDSSPYNYILEEKIRHFPQEIIYSELLTTLLIIQNDSVNNFTIPIKKNYYQSQKKKVF